MAIVVIAVATLTSCNENVPTAQTQLGTNMQQRWWGWVSSTPDASNPVKDQTGQFCAVNQPSDVWFLAGTFGGFSNQFMGVKQTTDVLEKGTWIFAGIIGVLCVLSSIFISGSAAASAPSKASDATLPSTSQPAPVNPSTLPLNTTTLPADSTKR